VRLQLLLRKYSAFGASCLNSFFLFFRSLMNYILVVLNTPINKQGKRVSLLLFRVRFTQFHKK
jgi:hypothetical protein